MRRHGCLAWLVALAPCAVLADPPLKLSRDDAQLDAEHPPLGKAAVDAEVARRPGRRKAPPNAGANKPATDEPEDATPQGRYGGVVPGGTNLPPRMPGVDRRGRKGRKGSAWVPSVTWLGFQVDKGLPTVFVELSRPVVWSVEEKPGGLVYTLQGATIPLANNRRPLDVTAFGTAVHSAVAERRGKDVVVTIRTGASGRPVHRERIEEAAGGLKLLLIELPEAEPRD